MNETPKNATEAWLALLGDVSLNGKISHPRGMKIREIINNSVAIDMRHPVVLTKERRLSYKFMAAEAWWILSGRSDVESIGRHCKAIRRFSDDGISFFGAYGPKISCQMEHVVRTLKNDRDTRQAVLTIWRENPPHTKDVPCTVSVQWLIRNGSQFQTLYKTASDWLEGHGLPIAGQMTDMFSMSWIVGMVQTTLSRLNGLAGFAMLVFAFAVLGLLEVEDLARRIAASGRRFGGVDLIEGGAHAVHL